VNEVDVEYHICMIYILSKKEMILDSFEVL